jgi:hypothetical protein
MKAIFLTATCVAAITCACPAFAQQTAPAVPTAASIPAVAAIATPPAPEVAATPVAPAVPTTGILRSGTSVPLRMVEGLTTKGKKLKTGYRFNLEVSAPVSVGGQVVIPVGSRAVGEVTHVKNKGMWGKSGAIEARILYVRVNDTQIRLTGQMDDKGVSGTAGVVGAVVVAPVIGFFVTGTSAKIPIGANVTAYVEEDQPVSFVLSPPAPLEVPVAAPAPVTPAPVATTTTS